MRKWWWKLAAFGVLTLVLLPILFLCFEHVRGQVSLWRYKRFLVIHGEKLRAQDLPLAPSVGENGAPEILAAQHELKDGVILPHRYPPRMKLTPSGHAIIGFRETEWVQDNVTNHWDQLAEDLEANAATLSRIRRALEKPVMDNRLDLSLGPKLLFSHLGPAKMLTHWFGASGQLALKDGRTREALDDLLAQIRLTRLMAEDRTLISELVRIAIAAIARTGTWEALQADGWTDEDLGRLQQAWASQSFIVGMTHGLEGELVFAVSSFDSCRKSNGETIKFIYALEEFLPPDNSDRPAWEQTSLELPGGKAAMDFLKKQVYCRVWRFAWLDQAERRYLESMERLLAFSRAATTNKSMVALEPGIDRLRKDSESRNAFDKYRYPEPATSFTVSGVISKVMRVETERSLVLCAVAVKRYMLRHGTAPASLDALVPELLPSVSVDYMDGKPIRYRRDGGGGFVLYSVGADGRDDGGDTALQPGRVNLRNIWDRKDCVWPAPALPEEIAASRDER
jgi:hypothetical protein